MDKYEYKLRSEEMLELIEKESFVEAANIADTIDWRRVKNISMLLRVAALYRVNRRNEDSRAVLLLAYDRYPANRSVVYSLCEVSIELDDVVAAIEYYKEFVKLAPRDIGVYTLHYRLLEAQEANLNDRISVLEELKRKDYQEEWLYELAYLYHRVGLETRCIEECNDLILWFGDGPYALKAMELKMLHAPLTEVQQKQYDAIKRQMQGEEEQSYAEEESQEAQYAYTGDENQEAQYVYADDDNNEYAYYDGNTYEQSESYVGSVYANQGEAYEQDDSYEEAEPAYEENVPKQSTGSMDMSQYNTINLQKVVAESMRELFADDEDVFSSEWIELDDDISDTIVVEKAAPEKEEAVPIPVPVKKTSTGRVAEMVTGVTEKAPEPNTGAISKVILPGNDARVIKEDTDMEELRAQTEEYIEEVQEMVSETETEQTAEDFIQEEEYTEEAVDHDYDIEETAENDISEETQVPFTAEILPQENASFTPMTGQMNLDEVLGEWERMKKEVQEKRKEEVKQNVLRQTGKIFQNFDAAVKSGILAELDEGGEIPVRTETFIDVGETEEFAPVQPLEEVKIQELAEESEEEEVFEELEEVEETQELSALEQVIAKELGGNTIEIPQEKVQEALQSMHVIEAEDDEEELTDELEEVYMEEEEAFEYDTYKELSESDPEEAYEDLAEYEEEAYLEEEELYSEEEMQDPDVMKTQEISMDTEEISNLPDKIIEATKKETKAARREELREFTPEEKELFENFAVTRKIRKQIIYALDTMSLAAYTGNVIITGEPGLDTIKLAKNLVREYQAMDANFSGKIARITGEKLNMRDLKEVFDKLGNGVIIIEKANGLTEETLYQLAGLLNQEELGIIVIMEDTRKEITKLLEKQAMIADYFNIRIDLMEMNNDALVAYAKNYALALEYSIDELGTLALYTRIANGQSGNHVVTKDEVREIVDEAIWKSRKFKIKNFVDVLFSKRYDSEDMIVLKERDFI